MRELWSQGETFSIVEHDAAPADALMVELWECPETYCSNVLTIACVKFGHSLMERWPEIFEEMGPVPWGQLDTRVRDALEGGVHVDNGVVTNTPGRGVQRHLHRYYNEWKGPPQCGAKDGVIHKATDNVPARTPGAGMRGGAALDRERIQGESQENVIFQVAL